MAHPAVKLWLLLLFTWSLVTAAVSGNAVDQTAYHPKAASNRWNSQLLAPFPTVFSQAASDFDNHRDHRNDHLFDGPAYDPPSHPLDAPAANYQPADAYATQPPASYNANNNNIANRPTGNQGSYYYYYYPVAESNPIKSKLAKLLAVLSDELFGSLKSSKFESDHGSYPNVQHAASHSDNIDANETDYEKVKKYGMTATVLLIILGAGVLFVPLVGIGKRSLDNWLPKELTSSSDVLPTLAQFVINAIESYEKLDHQ